MPLARKTIAWVIPEERRQKLLNDESFAVIYIRPGPVVRRPFGLNGG